MSQRLIELFAIAPAEWTEQHEGQLEAAILKGLADQLTLKVATPCEDPDNVAHFTAVNERIIARNPDVIHTSGRVWDRDSAAVQWNWSGYSPALKEQIRKVREAAKK